MPSSSPDLRETPPPIFTQVEAQPNVFHSIRQTSDPSATGRTLRSDVKIGMFFKEKNAGHPKMGKSNMLRYLRKRSSPFCAGGEKSLFRSPLRRNSPFADSLGRKIFGNKKPVSLKLTGFTRLPTCSSDGFCGEEGIRTPETL